MIFELCRTDTQIFMQYVQLKLQIQRPPSSKRHTLSQLHQGHMRIIFTMPSGQLSWSLHVVMQKKTYGLWFLPMACLTTVGLTKAS